MKGGGKGAQKTAEMPTKEDLEDGMSGVKPAGVSRVFKVASPEVPWLVLGMVLLVGSLAPGLLLPLLFGRMMDVVAEPGLSTDERHTRVDRMALEMIVLLLFGAVCVLLRAFVFNVAGERVVARLRIQLFKAIVSQEIGLFDKRKTGELLSRLSTDTTSLQDVATSNLSMFFRGVVQLVISSLLMFYTSWKLSVLAFTVVPVVVLGISLYGRAVKKLAVKYSDALSRSSDVAQETISNMRTVRSFAAEQVETIKYMRAVGNPDLAGPGTCCWIPSAKEVSTYRLGVQKQILSASFISFVTVVGSGACVLIVWVGCRLVIAGDLSPGELVTFALYSVQIAASIGMMMGLLTQVFVALGASRRTFQLIDRPPQVPASGGEYPETALVGRITFENVDFAYPSRPDVFVLKGFSLDIPVNKTFAFVGTSGAGKSTVLALIERFYDANAGRVLIDGRDVKSLDPRYFRRSMALVSQEPVLFGVTIAENISYGYSSSQGDPDAKPPLERIEEAAKAAFAHDFIMGFPSGYGTLTGERGIRLSGGQKQRIAIARALLSDTRVLLLDEATSALDAESEHFVQKAIDKLMANRTTLVVAHRLSTVRHADQIVVIDGGGIDAVGSHDELMSSSSKYQDLVRRQLSSGDDKASAPPNAVEPDATVVAAM
eukprot:gnl/TRDRNA2_/TRDRNA2_125020_c0_seq1.p1 gnl/TRDRNA2_/TRDRNA2_125020_c0~~gnl/TRDRNA2_/TRDRNA2_125020_c0_seq1.p1  ORF type:complete len:658 (+),score=119.57 gnl/TRDRNA2_/TRDRNA2_125020_c0_seq1:83-2056(+)